MSKIRTAENLLECDRTAINELILKEFGKSKADIKDYVNIMKEWTKSQPHLPETPSDDLIKQYLIFTKFSVEKAKKKLDMYYTVRTLMPEFFQNKHPLIERMVNQCELISIVVLPKLDPNFCRVLYFKVKKACIPQTMVLDDMIAHVLNRVDLFLRVDVVFNGVLICDLEHVTPAHLLRVDIMYLKKLVFIGRNVFAERAQAMHFINCQPFVNMLIVTLKSLLPKKLSDRVYFHQKVETLFLVIPKEICPADIGGNDASLQTLDELWQEKFKEHKERYDKLETLKVNEDLRPAPLENSDILGYHGNFKKLDVD